MTIFATLHVMEQSRAVRHPNSSVNVATGLSPTTTETEVATRHLDYRKRSSSEKYDT